MSGMDPLLVDKIPLNRNGNYQFFRSNYEAAADEKKSKNENQEASCFLTCWKKIGQTFIDR